MPKQVNWSQLLGWAIFALVLAGGPILNVIQSVIGIPLPGYTLPVLIALLMLGNVMFSAARNMRARRPNDGFPLESGNTSPMNAPMPPFGQTGTGLPRFGAPPSRMPPPSATPPMVAPRFPNTSSVPNAQPQGVRGPAYEPVVNPLLVVLGIIGFIVLVVGAVIFFIAP